MAFGLSSSTFSLNLYNFFFFYLVLLNTIQFSVDIIVVEFTQYKKDSVKVAMKAKLLQRTSQADQERKIMQEIQEINKKLSGHTHAGKSGPTQISLLKPQEDPQQKYFSEQCDDLFADHNFPLQANLQNPLDQSLFNSNSSLLLGNQFEKEVRNFPQFSTNQLSSQTFNFPANNSRSVHSKGAIHQTEGNSKIVQERNSDFIGNKNKRNFSSNNFMSKSSSQTSLNKKNLTIPCQNNLNQKQKNCEKSINKQIENKQNIQANLNVLKQPFIKQIKNKIRFQTQPDEHHPFNQHLQSFQKRKNQSKEKYEGFLMERIHTNKIKPHIQNSSLQCTFKPSILKKSHHIAENLQPSFQRLTQDLISKSQSKLPYKAKEQSTNKKYSIKRLQQLSQPRKQQQPTERQEPNYDFRPTLSKKSLSQMANCTMDVASRNKLWLQQKQAKINRLKEEEEQKKHKKQDGSFAPKITPYKGQNQVHLSRFTKQGISSYFERVSMAKQKNQVVDKKKVVPKEQVKQVKTCMKKKTYDEAIKELHKKILNMNI